MLCASLRRRKQLHVVGLFCFGFQKKKSPLKKLTVVVFSDYHLKKKNYEKASLLFDFTLTCFYCCHIKTNTCGLIKSLRLKSACQTSPNAHNLNIHHDSYHVDKVQLHVSTYVFYHWSVRRSVDELHVHMLSNVVNVGNRIP